MALIDNEPKLYELIEREKERQNDGLELIASENYVSEDVMEAVGSVLTNKYAEGYPNHRYYGGCFVVDEIENMAIERCKALFGAEHVNVQPHSGSQANMIAYAALLKHGDTILGMDLAHGGHLTHGSAVNFSGKTYNFVSYGVNKETETIDFDEVYKIADEAKPALIVAGASAYPRKLDFAGFRKVADAVGAKLMVDMAHIAGLVATNTHQCPVPYADIVTTTTHKTLRGPRGGVIMCREEYAKKVDKALFPGTQGGPLMHVVAGKAVCFGEASTVAFAEYGRQIVKNAAAMAAVFNRRGIRMVSGGTDNHLILLDVGSVGHTGREVETWLEAAHITTNKNAIPFDVLPPTVTSGVRVGTPAVTTRGLNEAECASVADMIADVVEKGESAIDGVRAEVLALVEKHPLQNP